MKTIVINTSKALEQTKLDILFKAPFDSGELIWYNVKLHEISTMPQEIYYHINKEDIHVFGYNLYVIVDLHGFPKSGVTPYEKFCGAFVHKYVEAELLTALKEKYHLPPEKLTLCFANTSTVKEGLSQEERGRVASGERNNRVEDRVFEALFGWNSNIESFDSIGWKMKYSESEDAYLDFSEVFKDIRTSQITLNEGEETEKIQYYERLKIEVNQLIARGLRAFDGENTHDAEDESYKTVRFVVERSNETEVLTGFFNLLANIVLWTYSAADIGTVKLYSVGEIKDMLSKCAKKYSFYSDDRNMSVKYLPLDVIINKKEAISDAWTEKWKGTNTKASAGATANADNTVVGKIQDGSLDKRFGDLLKEIINNYASGLIKGENEEITTSLIKKVKEMRLKHNEKDFVGVVDGLCTEENKASRDILMPSALDKEYDLIVEEITKAEIDFFGNDDILQETMEKEAEYNNLKRKGKWSLISLIGGIVSVFAAIYPYVEIRSNVNLYSHVNWLFILPFVGAVAGIYVLAATIYFGYILSQKAAVIKTLQQKKTDSESARKQSIEAFTAFCNEILPKAEAITLMRRELKRRDEENNKIAIKFSAHKAKFNELYNLVQGYKTKLRMPEQQNERSCDACEFPALAVNKDYYCEENQLAYSVLDLIKAVDEGTTKEEGEE